MYWTVVFIQENKKQNLIDALNEVVYIYKVTGFKTTTFYRDIELKASEPM